MFAKFAFDNYVSRKPSLLGYASFQNEVSQKATENVFPFVLRVEGYGETFERIASVTGNNGNFLNAFLKQATKPIIIWASHCFNLAVRDVLDSYEDSIDDVQR